MTSERIRSEELWVEKSNGETFVERGVGGVYSVFKLRFHLANGSMIDLLFEYYKVHEVLDMICLHYELHDSWMDDISASNGLLSGF